MSKQYGWTLEKLGFPIMFQWFKKEYGNENVILIDRREQDDDYKNVTDVILIKNGDKFRVGARYRNPYALDVYPIFKNFTIRCKAPSNGRTELDKLKEGVGCDLYFYAVFKDYHYKTFRDAILINVTTLRYKEIWGDNTVNMNRDNKTAYITIPIMELERRRAILKRWGYLTLDENI